MEKTQPKSVGSYIAGFPENVQSLLRQIRSIIQKEVPDAEEGISYGVAGYRWKGRQLVYFAGFKNHVSVYPAPRSEPSFAKELEGYRGGKGTVQFPLDQPLPLQLIRRIVQHRMKDTMERNDAGKHKKAAK